MFGISFSEILLVAVIALLFVGPQRLPGMLARIGRFIGKIRRLTTEMRAQTGIDDILRDEGLEGGISELRSIVRGDIRSAVHDVRVAQRNADPYESEYEFDRTREYPPEGADAYGAIPDDLLDAYESPVGADGGPDAPPPIETPEPATDAPNAAELTSPKVDA